MSYYSVLKITATMKRNYFAILFCLFSLLTATFAKEKSESITILWPNSAQPTLKVTFARFVELASYNHQLSLQSQVLVENLSAKEIPQASFTVYMLDKNKVRIGNGTLNISDLGPSQQAKILLQMFSVGLPASLDLVARNDSTGVPTSMRTVPLKIISKPPAAMFKVDGKDVGITPATVNLTVGNHILEFSKDGYASGSTPVDIKSDEAPGGSITFELGGLSRDNLQLRDGNVIQGDVISMSMTSVVVRIDGKDQTFDRNQVKEIVLVEREATQQPTVAQPTTSSDSK
jgi:hypothetical protein